jgi:hypothetical protein
VTVGTNNDKTGYSLAASQTFNLTGNVTGSLSGSVGSVTGDVGGNVQGNVVGSVGSVTGLNPALLDVAVSTRLSSSYGTAITATAAGVSSLITSVAALPTADQNATAWGARDIGNGRTADMYLQGLCNLITFSADGTTWTLYSTDDATPLYTGTSTRLATTVGGLRSINPTGP